MGRKGPVIHLLLITFVCCRSSLVNECQTDNGGCPENSICIDHHPQGQQCHCKSGYNGSASFCGDLNECATHNGGCSGRSSCVNSDGSYSCDCSAGYEPEGHGGTSCSDINECATQNGGCDGAAACHNSVGSYNCNCNSGYEGNGLSCSRFTTVVISVTKFDNQTFHQTMEHILNNAIQNVAVTPDPASTRELVTFEVLNRTVEEVRAHLQKNSHELDSVNAALDQAIKLSDTHGAHAEFKSQPPPPPQVEKSGPLPSPVVLAILVISACCIGTLVVWLVLGRKRFREEPRPRPHAQIPTSARQQPYLYNEFAPQTPIAPDLNIRDYEEDMQHCKILFLDSNVPKKSHIACYAFWGQLASTDSNRPSIGVVVVGDSKQKIWDRLTAKVLQLGRVAIGATDTPEWMRNQLFGTMPIQLSGHHTPKQWQLGQGTKMLPLENILPQDRVTQFFQDRHIATDIAVVNIQRLGNTEERSFSDLTALTAWMQQRLGFRPMPDGLRECLANFSDDDWIRLPKALQDNLVQIQATLQEGWTMGSTTGMSTPTSFVTDETWHVTSSVGALCPYHSSTEFRTPQQFLTNRNSMLKCSFLESLRAGPWRCFKTELSSLTSRWRRRSRALFRIGLRFRRGRFKVHLFRL